MASHKRRAKNTNLRSQMAMACEEQETGEWKQLPLEYQIEPGRAHPLGAIPDENGVNFSIFAERATSVELLLFDKHDDLKPIHTIQLDPYKHRTFYFWHVYVRGIKPGIHYAYRVDGFTDVHGRGDRYKRNKVLSKT